MWKKWKFWDKYYKKSMLRAFAGRELKKKRNARFQIFMWMLKLLDARLLVMLSLVYIIMCFKKIHFGFNFEINEFAIKPITSRFSLLHHRTMEIWIFQPNAEQV